MAFPESFLQELTDKNDIVDVVGEYVSLTKRSGANLFGLCPFHNEKTPSFSVSRDRQIYHCFGCGKGGGVINFIMEMENLGYPDAVAYLAKRAGMQLPEDDDPERRNRRERLLALNRDAARFFHEELVKPSGRVAQDYLVKRNILPATATKFGLGFAPDSFYALTDAMKQKGYQDYELISAGLAAGNKSGNGVHDLFRNRLIFPVIDIRGNVIAFSGRILGDGEPKYYNTKDTPVFSKSKNLFGLNFAKNNKSGAIILLEGNVDVVTLHQNGFDSAVASLGTSLTSEQAHLISRFTKKVILAYDEDSAGQKASARAISVLQNLDLEIKILHWTDAKDPDEFINKFGRDAFANLLEGSEDQLEYRFSAIRRKYQIEKTEEKVKYLNEIVDFLSSIPNEVTRQVYELKVSDETGIKMDILMEDVKKKRNWKRSQAKKQQDQNQTRNITAPRKTAGIQIKYEQPEIASAEKNLILLMYHDPSLFDRVDLKAEEFSNTIHRKLFSALRELSEKITGAGPVSPDLLANTPYDLNSNDIAYFTDLIHSTPVDSANVQAHLKDCLQKVKMYHQERDLDDLRALANTLKKNNKGYGGKNG